MSIELEISVGEFLDKLTILEIKSERISDAGKLNNINNELAMLKNIWAGSSYAGENIDSDIQALKEINEELWDIEDEIRDKEAKNEFDEKFIELARSVYIKNDTRALIKRRLNINLNSGIVEEKSYSDYGRDD